MYNLTTLQSSAYVVDLVTFANDTTGGVLITGFVIAIFFTVLLALKTRNDFDESLTTASFISFVLTSFLVISKLISIYFMFGFLFLTGLGIFLMYVAKNKY